jgi:hypothetical protein
MAGSITMRWVLGIAVAVYPDFLFAQDAVAQGKPEHSLILNPPVQPSAGSNVVPPTKEQSPTVEELPISQPTQANDNSASSAERMDIRAPSEVDAARNNPRDQQRTSQYERSILTRDTSVRQHQNAPEAVEQNRNYDRAGGSSIFGVEFDSRSNNGAVVDYVERGTPAYYAGLRRDDIVVGLNGKQVNAARDAIQIIESADPGQRFEVDLLRPTHVEVAVPYRGAKADLVDYQGGEQNLRMSPDTNRAQRDSVNASRDREKRSADDRDPRGSPNRVRNFLSRFRN